jgi:hypothetical protein
MKKTFIFLCSCLLLLAGCKKENTDLNKSTVSIVVFPIEEDGTSGSLYNFKLKAMVVSPSKVEMVDHGFIVIDGGPTGGTPISLGPKDLVGKIEANYSSPLPIGQFSIAAYAQLANGETIYSDGYTPPANAGNVVITSSSFNPSFAGFATFEGSIVSGDTKKLMITEIGVEYALSSDFSTNGGIYTGFRFNPSSSTTAVTPIFLQYPIDGIVFLGKANYNYRLYTRVLDVTTTNITTIYGPDLVFTTP